MRLVLASNSLLTLGGSETYLLTLARHLQRYGHEVYTMEGPGNVGTLSEREGLKEIRHPSELTHPPDRIIVQDAIVAGEAAAAWPGVPQLFVVHSSIHDLQMTSAVPSEVVAYVALNEMVASRARALAGDRTVHRLTQPIDVGHFTPGQPPRDVPKVLLVFGNNKASWRFEALEQACARRGIEVRRIGAVADSRVHDPVPALQEADIVVGYGRCILEAMACGRTAFVFDRFGSDGWVNAETYPTLEASGFNGTAAMDEPGRHVFDDVLDAYAPEWGAVGHDLAFRHHHARTHAKDILEIVEGLGPVDRTGPDLAFTLARVWRESWRWESQVVGLSSHVAGQQAEIDRLNQEIGRLQSEHATNAANLSRDLATAADRVVELEAQLEAINRSGSYRLARGLMRLKPPWRSA